MSRRGPASVVVVRVDAHRAGPIERPDGDDVLEAGRLHPAQQVPHRAALKLEHSERVTGGQCLEGLGVVQGQGDQVDVDTVVVAHVGNGIAQNGEVAQTQEVHLQQADVLAGRIVPAGDDGAVVTHPHRDRVGKRLARHDHGAGVDARVANQSFQAARGFEDRGDVRVGLDELADLRGLGIAGMSGVDNAGQRDVLGHDRRRKHLGDTVGDREAWLPVQDASGILDRGLGLNGAECDDLRDLVAAVRVGGVADHLAAAAVVEVDVEVRHRLPFRVEEPLEQQPVRNGVDVGDAQYKRHQAARTGASAGADKDA